MCTTRVKLARSSCGKFDIVRCACGTVSRYRQGDDDPYPLSAQQASPSEASGVNDGSDGRSIVRND